MSTKELKRCTYCGATYLAVDWLAYRTRGYCCAKCEKDAKEAGKD